MLEDIGTEMRFARDRVVRAKGQHSSGYQSRYDPDVVEAQHESFVAYCNSIGADPADTRAKLLKHAKHYGLQYPGMWPVGILNELPTPFNVRGVWTP
jgi:hypothetical protein